MKRIMFSSCFMHVLAAILMAATTLGLATACELLQITVATPVITPASGTIQPGQTISIVCSTPKATIRYTLDGSNPGIDSPVYTAPLPLIPGPMTLKAQAFMANYNPSEIVTASLTLDTSNGDVLDMTDTGALHSSIPGGNVQVSLDLDSPKDVYYIFSNTNLDHLSSAPLCFPDLSIPASTSSSPGSRASQGKYLLTKNRTTPSTPVKSRASSPASYELEATKHFVRYNGSSPNGTDTTLRYLSPTIATAQGNRVLRIWVADNCWGTSSNMEHELTLNMLEQCATRFLQAGSDNDIYDWVTGILGPEWGETGNPDTIGPTPYIDFVIDDTNTWPYRFYSYFRPTDLMTVPSVYGTRLPNEMLTIYIDANILADPSLFIDFEPVIHHDAPEWNLETCAKPNKLLSCLAHELQHMVNFYHNMTDTAYQPGMDEMMSLCVEDLLADKIHTPGPRGGAGTDYATAWGSSDGLIPWFNKNNHLSLFGVNTAYDIESDYAIGYNINDLDYIQSGPYAFGAWLIRNFGGPAILKAILDQPTLDGEALTKAVAAVSGQQYSLGDLMSAFGSAMVLSDRSDQVIPQRFQTGATGSTAGFEFDWNSVTYRLGDINFWNYVSGSTDNQLLYGPIMPEKGLCREGQINPGANAIYRLASNFSGSFDQMVSLPDGVVLTVVVK